MFYIQKIYSLPKDKPTSEIGYKKIIDIINKDLEKDGANSKKLKAYFSTIFRYLN